MSIRGSSDSGIDNLDGTYPRGSDSITYGGWNVHNMRVSIAIPKAASSGNIGMFQTVLSYDDPMGDSPVWEQDLKCVKK